MTDDPRPPVRSDPDAVLPEEDGTDEGQEDAPVAIELPLEPGDPDGQPV